MTSHRYILIVDDERAIREMIAFGLRRSGFQAAEAHDAATARSSIVSRRPDLVLLDWTLPDRSGLELARELKREAATQCLPIIMLSGRVEEQDRIIALDSGADDYVTKPFSPRELLARINAVLRRSFVKASKKSPAAPGLVLEAAGRRLSFDGREVQLGPTDYRLLSFLMAHPERVHSRTQVLDQVWGDTAGVEERTVDVHIRRLRQALEPCRCDQFIQTVRGTGYRFSTRVE